MDLIDKVKNIFKEADPIVEGSSTAYSQVMAMDDKTLRKLYLGKAPVYVPREAQEELYKRFVKPHAHYNCSQCYGRGHTGWNDELHQLVPCQCLQRVIRKEVAKENEGYLYDPSGNKITFSN